MLNRKEVCHLLGLTANTKTLSGWNLTRYVTADLYNPSSQYSLELEVRGRVTNIVELDRKLLPIDGVMG